MASSTVVEAITAKREMWRWMSPVPVVSLKIGPEQRQRLDTRRHAPADQDAEQTARSHDGHGFRQKLEQNRAARRADRFQNADLARSLRHRNQHDVGEADAADRQRQRADQSQQHLQRGRHGVDDFHEFVEDDHLQRAFVGRREIMHARQHGPHILDRLLAEHRVRRHPDDVVRIFDVVEQRRGRERNEDAFVVRRVVIRDLRFGLQQRRRSETAGR